jgi:hypothetical protein
MIGIFSPFIIVPKTPFLGAVFFTGWVDIYQKACQNIIMFKNQLVISIRPK